ncbi:hypothetical protein GCM10011571_31160 [Marinithermofilum abyssi]|uniref:Uncharacterized protein n=1 Tax=Marinithermofilum abyssi TaxID=1571185 RepID=A0A8J2VKD3_9BACL|nr:hypothetical protein [Marinithermofilum abyssi]GGE26714.1 hypothetical protein GCM10011571_31160 [Marinithermofilum abyssi]
MDTKQLANISHPVIVAPKLNPDPFVYVVRDGKDEYSLRLWQADGKEKLLEKRLDVKQVKNHRLVEWSPSGKYILVGGNRIYRASDGRIAKRLNGTAGTWSPERDRLLYVAQNRSAPGWEAPLPALAGFYLSSRRDRMLVMEEGSQGTQLRLIDLLSHQKEEAADLFTS